MIEKMTGEQVAAVYTAWLMISNPPAERPFHTHDEEAFAAGRQWAIERPFDTVMAVVEFFTWNLACDLDTEMDEDGFHFDHFQAAMWDEVGENDTEFNNSANPHVVGIDYQRSWIEGVADGFTLMGGNVIMGEWNVTTRH
jgi:hypothetical protein